MEELHEGPVFHIRTKEETKKKNKKIRGTIQSTALKISGDYFKK
jgi:hypothetical protein